MTTAGAEALALGPISGDEAEQLFVMFADVVTMAAQMKGGKIRSLAIASNVQLPTLPETPTVAATVPGFDTSSWWGVSAPRGTPAEIVDKLNKAINAGFADQKFRERLADLGGDGMPGTPADFGKVIADETEKWRKVVKFANLKAE